MASRIVRKETQKKYYETRSSKDFPLYFADESDDMNYEGILGNKQHLNLSRKAYAILMDDMLSFSFDSFSGYLNRIFLNYYEWADSSISRCLDRMQQLEEQLMRIGQCTETTMESFLNQEANRLLVKSKSYPKGVGLKFYLNKQNIEILEREFAYEATWYQGHPMRYFRCVIEEYAEKNRLEREEILFRKEIERLNQCAEDNQLVCIKISDNVYETKPYQVIPDYNAMHYYLAGISRPMNTSQEEDRIASFRISRIQSIRPRPKTYRSGRLTLAEQKMLIDRLDKDGVQFLLDPSVEIELKLTFRGMERFHNQAHLRPQLESYEEVEGGYLCRFQCTETQIRYYFFQFGADVEILAPAGLRDFFRDRYKEAYTMYANKE